MDDTIAAIVAQVLGMIPGLIQAGVAIEGLIQATIAALNSGSTNPTDAVWQQVNDMIDANTAKINTDPPTSPTP